jgi:hypothetical protein
LSASVAQASRSREQAGLLLRFPAWPKTDLTRYCGEPGTGIGRVRPFAAPEKDFGAAMKIPGKVFGKAK